jgi:hypothetical protein
MRKSFILLATGILLLGLAFSDAAVARDRSDLGELSANQIVDQIDATIARIKANLRLTSDQESNWSGFATVMHDIAKKRADRQTALQAELAQKKSPVDIIDQIRKEADVMREHSVDQKKLADAAEPLYSILDDKQKAGFAEALFRLSH